MTFRVQDGKPIITRANEFKAEFTEISVQCMSESTVELVRRDA